MSQSNEQARKPPSFTPDYLSLAAALVALAVSFGLQFVRYIEPVIGRSDPAVSGATILAVSLVFTGLMFLASHHYLQRVQEHQAALHEAAAVARLIERGQHSAARIRSHKNRNGL